MKSLQQLEYEVDGLRGTMEAFRVQNEELKRSIRSLGSDIARAETAAKSACERVEHVLAVKATTDAFRDDESEYFRVTAVLCQLQDYALQGRAFVPDREAVALLREYIRKLNHEHR